MNWKDKYIEWAKENRHKPHRDQVCDSTPWLIINSSVELSIPKEGYFEFGIGLDPCGGGAYLDHEEIKELYAIVMELEALSQSIQELDHS